VGDRTGQGARATGEEPRYTHQARLSPADNSLRAFFAAHPDMARRVRVVDAHAAHVIDLLQPLGM
jgi:hypothetical protein